VEGFQTLVEPVDAITKYRSPMRRATRACYVASRWPVWPHVPDEDFPYPKILTPMYGHKLRLLDHEIDRRALEIGRIFAAATWVRVFWHQDAFARFRKTISWARSTKARKLAAMWRRPG
jgi:hypothetical protein